MTLQVPVIKKKNWKYIFFPFWISQAISLLGSSIVQFALVWWLTKTIGLATVLAAATTFAILPEIIINPFAGAIVDRINRKYVMIVADSIIAVATLGLALLFYLNLVEIWHIYAVMFIRSAGSAFHYPAQQASITNIVPKQHLARIAGINQSLQGLVRIIAAPLGALMLETFSVQGSLGFDILTALFAIMILACIPIPHQRREENIDHGWVKTILNDMKAGFNYLLNWKGLLAVVILAMFIKIALSPAISFIPLLVNQHFNGDASQYSLVEIAIGVGMISGGLILGIWGGFKKHIWTSFLGIVGLGVSFMCVSFLSSGAFSSLIGCMFVAGLMVPLIDGPLTAIIQACVDDAFQGRVLTIMSSLLWITTPIGLGIAGPVSDKIGVSSWYLIAGVFCLIGVFTGLFFPTLLNIEDNNQSLIARKVDINY
jgi:MFS transporter, DHA3 family, macrolide efflux protein